MKSVVKIGLGLIFGLSALATQAHELAWNTDFPDPGMIKTREGYFIYGTQTIVPPSRHRKAELQNIQIGFSKDLSEWKRLGDALPVKPTWASKTQSFWAPDITFHDGIYYLYFSAAHNPLPKNRRRGRKIDLGMCVGVATATTPQGPFIDSGAPLTCAESFQDIDPMVFDDPATGKTLLYWGSGFGPIRVQELAENRIEFKTDSKPVSLLFPRQTTSPTQYDRLLEGAWMLKHGDYYFLFTSGDNCCGSEAHYAVMVSRSKGAFGPFTVPPGKEKILIKADSRWLAPGHNAIIDDNDGTLWAYYHAIDRTHPLLNPSIPGDRTSRRVLLRSKIEFKDNWPSVH